MMCTTVLHGGVCNRTSTPHKSGNKMKEKKEGFWRQSKWIHLNNKKQMHCTVHIIDTSLLKKNIKRSIIHMDQVTKRQKDERRN